jgi:hypothetical protein
MGLGDSSKMFSRVLQTAIEKGLEGEQLDNYRKRLGIAGNEGGVDPTGGWADWRNNPDYAPSNKPNQSIPLPPATRGITPPVTPNPIVPVTPPVDNTPRETLDNPKGTITDVGNANQDYYSDFMKVHPKTYTKDQLMSLVPNTPAPTATKTGGGIINNLGQALKEILEGVELGPEKYSEKKFLENTVYPQQKKMSEMQLKNQPKQLSYVEQARKAVMEGTATPDQKIMAGVQPKEQPKKPLNLGQKLMNRNAIIAITTNQPIGKNKDGSPLFSGIKYNSVDEAIAHIEEIRNDPDIKDNFTDDEWNSLIEDVKKKWIKQHKSTGLFGLGAGKDIAPAEETGIPE